MKNLASLHSHPTLDKKELYLMSLDSYNFVCKNFETFSDCQLELSSHILFLNSPYVGVFNLGIFPNDKKWLEFIQYCNLHILPTGQHKIGFAISSKIF